MTPRPNLAALSEREMFEVAWMRRYENAKPGDREYYRSKLGRSDDGAYYDPEVEAAWWAWQAALASREGA